MHCASRVYLRAPHPEDLRRILDWMQDPAVHRWFDFGMGRQQLGAVSLSLMARSPQHCMRIFSDQPTGDAIGLVVLSEVTHPFGLAGFWVVRDRERHAYRGITADATRKLLHEGFARLGRTSINAWAVESNARSLSLLHSVGFRPYGVQRACHRLGDQLLGRVHLELLPDGFYNKLADMEASVQCDIETGVRHD